MNAKQQAIKDIKESLKKDGKCFINYRNELNIPIRKIINEQLREQRAKSKTTICGFYYSKKVEFES